MVVAITSSLTFLEEAQFAITSYSISPLLTPLSLGVTISLKNDMSLNTS